MASCKKNAEFILYQVPNGEDVLVLLGSSWIRQYGIDSIIPGQHFTHFYIGCKIYQKTRSKQR